MFRWLRVGLLSSLVACSSSLGSGGGQGEPADAAPFPTSDARSGAGADGATCQSEELCNGLDDDCDGAVDEGAGCVHAVACAVFDDGYANQTAADDAIFSPAPGQACVPGGAAGECRRWFGRCQALAGEAGHAHEVSFHVFDDGYQNLAGPADAVLVAADGRVCIPGGAEGQCRAWFGRGETDVVAGHSHAVECAVFDDGYTNQSGPSDAIAMPGPEQACIGGQCGRWFGLCRTVSTIPASPGG